MMLQGKVIACPEGRLTASFIFPAFILHARRCASADGCPFTTLFFLYIQTFFSAF